MSFERARRVAALWNWLPVFRTAAEYESLQRAALALSLSPSAVSRTVKQLEDALGAPVFDRTPAGVTLTPAGARLLRATRDAMRIVDDGLEAPALEVRVGGVGPFLPTLLAQAIDDAQPFTLQSVVADDAGASLLRGETDVVLAHAEDDDAAVSCERVGDLQLVAAGPAGAPLTRVVSWPLGPTFPNAVMDRVEDLQAMLAFAARGRAVLIPAALRPASLEVRAELPERLPVFCLTRRALAEGTAPRHQALLAALRAALR